MEKSSRFMLSLGIFLCLGYALFYVDSYTGFAIASLNGSVNTMNVGEELKVDVIVTNVSDLAGAQIDISYNPNVISFTRVGEGSFLNEGGTIPTYFNQSQISPSEGMIENILIYRLDSKGVNGSGVLFSLFLKANGPGVSGINISKAILADSKGSQILSPLMNTSVTVSPSTDSSGGDSSGGGGGGGGSSSGGSSGSSSSGVSGGSIATSPTITETQTVNNVFSDGVTTFTEFSSETGIKQVDIITSADIQDVEVKISKYDGRPLEISNEKSGEVYSYLQIEIERANNQIEEAIITFNVDKGWLNEKGIETGRVSLFKYDEPSEEWISLPTTFIEEDGDYSYFSAKLNGFSYFAIGEKELVENKTLQVLMLIVVIVTAFVLLLLIIYLRKSERLS